MSRVPCAEKSRSPLQDTPDYEAEEWKWSATLRRIAFSERLVAQNADTRRFLTSCTSNVPTSRLFAFYDSAWSMNALAASRA